MDFLQLPVEKLKNKVICDKHFPESCFMNYSRSKLNKTTAVPTIYFNPDEVEIDLLKKPTSFVLENREKKQGSVGYSSNTGKSIDMDDSSEQQTTVMKSSLGPPSSKRIKTEFPIATKKLTEMRILNKLPVTLTAGNSQLITVSQFKETIQQKSPPSQQYSKTRAKVIEKPKVFQASSTPKVVKHEILAAPIIPEEDEQYEVITILPEEVLPASSPTKPFNDSTAQEIKVLIKEVAEIKSLLHEKAAAAVAQVPSPSTSICNESNITQSHLNKIQLFNGIKRYLSPSLIALLRMEIFAAPNREHKKDEKIICDEILKLGDEVYDFFAEEWRLRLPSKDQVKSWQSDELIDDDAS